jgi:hypothetical protein
MPTFADRIANSIMKSHDAVGLLMYGSAVNDPDSAADVDIICITRNHGHRHFMDKVRETTIDVYADTRDGLKKSLRSDKRDNNNFILNGFVHGRPLMKLDDSVDALTAIAEEVWRAGPPEPSASERKAIELALTKGLNAAKSYVSRADRSPEWRGIATINIGQIFLRAMYAYCRAHRLWSSTLSEMLEWKDDVRYSDLIILCSSFLRAESLAEQTKVLADITDLTVSQDLQAMRVAV